MKSKINKIYNLVEDWEADEIERLIDELTVLLDIKLDNHIDSK